MSRRTAAIGTPSASARSNSLCADGDNRKWASDRPGYRSDIDDDGFPVDPRHPGVAASCADNSE
jgi:hypothetical protein